VEVYTTADAAKFSEVHGHQLSVLDAMGLTRALPHQDPALPASDLIIDAVIGSSLRRAPSGAAASVLSLDVPSGIVTASGTVYEPAVAATATMTLALPKRGLGSAEARPKVGELYLADISMPPALYQEPVPGLDVGPLFAQSQIIRVW
jgi:NAD(P)H-hydrate epimerase